MKVYCATYILNSDMKGNLVDWFEFEQKKDSKWEKTDYGYFRSEGWICDKAENNVNVNSYLWLVKNEKYFDKELSEAELRELELEMRKECVIALENKRKQLVNSLTRQIEYILR